ncbi:macB-like periplasmic core domain protein, partial [Vibrio parahaemolyticus V-223/04]
AYSIAKP